MTPTALKDRQPPLYPAFLLEVSPCQIMVLYRDLMVCAVSQDLKVVDLHRYNPPRTVTHELPCMVRLLLPMDYPDFHLARLLHRLIHF